MNYLWVGEESSGNLISYVKEAKHTETSYGFFCVVFFFPLINIIKIFGKHLVKAKHHKQENFPSML